MSRTPLSEDAIKTRMGELSGWKLEGGHLMKTFEFDDFVSAFGWMSSVALVAEKLNHHPNWSNVYKTVEVELWSHDAGGLTPADFELAGHMDRLATG